MQVSTSSVHCNIGTHDLIKVGYCGGSEGSPKDMDDVITSITRIVQIGIRHGQGIDAIKIRFERNGYAESTDIWGGTGGSPVVVDFQPTEYITAVKGRTGYLNQNYIVKSLFLETNLSTYGPYGEEIGTPFELSAGGQIIGFYVLSGYYVFAIGVYVKVLTGIPPSVRSPAIKKLGPCGGCDGTLRVMDATGITRILKIGIRHSQVIDALIVRFQRNDVAENTNLLGGPGGKLTVINFQPSEHITTVKGYTGYYKDRYVLTSLKLETNMGNIYGPYGLETGAPFELSALGGQIIGFFARSELWLDAIGVYIMAPSTSILRNTGHTVRKIGLCGGGGGEVKDMDVSDVTRITKIDIRLVNFSLPYDDVLVPNQLTCIVGLLVHFERNGCEESTDQWGRPRGDLTTIYFQPMEYIMSIKGSLSYMGSTFCVGSLMLETNLRTHGPYGIDTGTPFELSAPGGKIIGLHARSGDDFVDAIGVYVKV